MSRLAGCVIVTQSNEMVGSRRGFLWLWAATACVAPGATGDYLLDAPHPRLLLAKRHRRLIERERERRSLRWLQLESLLRGTRKLPEPGFAYALGYAAGGGEEYGRKAIDWALDQGDDLRQAAIVFDWCYGLLDERERRQLAAKLQAGLEKPRAADLASVQARVLAAAAVSGEIAGAPERELQWAVETWWRGMVIPALRAGKDPFPREQTYPLVEIFHVIRDNLRIDLRRDARKFFTSWPSYLLLTYYPALYPAAENEYHIPLMRRPGRPDLRVAALARAADLALVAYDPNSLEVQFLQGWAMQDSLMMRGPFGAPYEFLWANPYHPGLSYYSAPLVHYDAKRGRLVARASWDAGALWFYYGDGLMQTFEEGRIKPLTPEKFRLPLYLGGVAVAPFWGGRKFQITEENPRTFFLLGLLPRTRYDVEVDDEELFEAATDAAGILKLEFPHGRAVGVRIHEAPVGGGSGTGAGAGRRPQDRPGA